MDHRGRRSRGPLARRSRLRRQRHGGGRRQEQAPTPARRASRRQDGRQADGPVDRRRRSHRLRPDLLPDGSISSATRRRSSCTRTSPTTATDDGPGPRRRRPAGLRGRQDRHGQDQARRQVLAAVRTNTVTSRTSSTRSSAASSPPSPQGFTQSYYADLEGAKVGVKAGTKISGHHDAGRQTLVLKFKRAVGGVMAAGALALRRDRARARGVRREVRRRDAVDLRREPARDRART